MFLSKFMKIWIKVWNETKEAGFEKKILEINQMRKKFNRLVKRIKLNCKNILNAATLSRPKKFYFS